RGGRAAGPPGSARPPGRGGSGRILLGPAPSPRALDPAPGVRVGDAPRLDESNVRGRHRPAVLLGPPARRLPGLFHPDLRPPDRLYAPLLRPDERRAPLRDGHLP